MILLIDNYDSFVYNLARYVAELGCETKVVRNDAITTQQALDLSPDAVILSPGPCTPEEAGICIELVREADPELPILGVCLGHQAVAAAFGGSVVRARVPVHGRSSPVDHSQSRLLSALPSPFQATRYHSLIVQRSSLPEELAVTATGDGGIVMAIEHVSRPVFGVQFHPESVLTEQGHLVLHRFLQIAGIPVPDCPAPERVGPIAQGPEEDFVPEEKLDTRWSSSPVARPLHW